MSDAEPVNFSLASQNPNAKKIAEDIIKRTSNG